MQEKNNLLKTPIRYFKGVGPKKGELLKRLKLETVEGILYYLPMRYEDRSNLTPIKDSKVNENQTIQGEIITLGTRLTKTGIPIFQMAVTDHTGFLHAVWFNQPYLKDYFKKGQKVILYGRLERYDKLQIVQPEYEIVKGDDADHIHIGRIVPIYGVTSGLGQRYMRSLVFSAVSKYCRFLVERLPTYLLAREKLVDIKFAIKNIHFPSSFQNLEKAYRRLVFEEFFLLQLALAARKKEMRAKERSLGYKVQGELQEAFKMSLSFEFTEGQKKATAEIEADMSKSAPMSRLLEGDVGSGKTVVAAYALTLAVQNGFQGCVMAPTEVLARQHALVLSELLMPIGINVGLLVGGIEPKTKDRIRSETKDNKINILVGTHAIIEEAVEFRNLGLAVIDEQHKFGVTQRSILTKKGKSVHLLVMTATPIPRTLALTVYGDLDISVIKEAPKGRKPITTYWVEEEKRNEVYNFIKEELDKGHQAYVICPLIEEGKGLRIKGKGVTAMYERLKNEIFPNYEVGLLHGRMASREKERMMRDFKKGKIQVLVSTIVIEVGIDIPNATVMLIENADRFGLAQLHQLRGRVGRGEHQSYCILLADPKSKEARQRLEAIMGTLDGFQIAEADLKIRGPGEFYGERQHGLPEIRFGDILKDFDIMECARKEAFELVAKDPDLAEEHHRLLKAALDARFKGKLDVSRVG